MLNNIHFYHPYTQPTNLHTEESQDCSICFEPLNQNDVVAHGPNAIRSDAQDLHPVHRICIKKWLAEKDSCPECRQQIDRNSLMSYGERIFGEITQAFKEGTKAVTPGAVIALLVIKPFAFIIFFGNIPVVGVSQAAFLTFRAIVLYPLTMGSSAIGAFAGAATANIVASMLNYNTEEREEAKKNCIVMGTIAGVIVDLGFKTIGLTATSTAYGALIIAIATAGTAFAVIEAIKREYQNRIRESRISD